MLGHLNKKTSVFKKHTRESHAGVQPSFKMKPIRSSRTNLERCVAEGVLMEEVETEFPGQLMNSKSEGGRGKLVRYGPQVRRI